MKSTIWIIMSVIALAIDVPAALITGTVDSDASMGVTTNALGEWDLGTAYRSVGDIAVGGPTARSGVSTLERGCFNFEYDASSAPGTTVSSASLSIELTAKAGAGISSDDTISLWVSYDRDNTSLFGRGGNEEADFNGGTGSNYTVTWVDTGIDVATGDTELGMINLDVTSIAQTLIDVRTSGFVAFQMRIDNDLTKESDGVERYEFGEHPSLNMEVVPEPATLSILVFGSLSTMLIRRVCW